MFGQCLFIVSTHEVCCHELQARKTKFPICFHVFVVSLGKVCFFQVMGHFISTRRGEFSASISLNVCVLAGHLLVSKGLKM